MSDNQTVLEDHFIVGRVVPDVQFEPSKAKGWRFIYGLQCAETKCVKIGVTENWEQRFKDIRAMSPTKLETIMLVIAESSEMETHLHRQFAPFRLHGEWFNDTNGVVTYALRCIQTRYQRAIDNLEAFRTEQKQLLEIPSAESMKPEEPKSMEVL